MDSLRTPTFDGHVSDPSAAIRVEQTSTPGHRIAISRDHRIGPRYTLLGEITRLIDSTPVPCGKSRETVKRSNLAGHAGYGYFGSHSRYFWGFRLYLVCAPDGMPIVWGLANPKIGEREATETMLRHDKHLIRPGQIFIGDKGFAGKDFENFITGELEAELIRPDRKDEKPRFGKLGGIRQWVESVFDTMKGQLTLEDHGGRTIPVSSSPHHQRHPATNSSHRTKTNPRGQYTNDDTGSKFTRR